jgi:hypothetical protein
MVFMTSVIFKKPKPAPEPVHKEYVRKRKYKSGGQKQPTDRKKARHRGKQRPLKEILYRSKVELSVAVDLKDYKPEYEAKRFPLWIPVKYVPDFYIKELDLWIEVKGTFTLDDCKKCTAFVEDGHRLLVVLQKLNAKMMSRKSTNESFLDTADIPYCYAANVKEVISGYFDRLQRGSWDGIIQTKKD